jgi:hypothetical protein
MRAGAAQLSPLIAASDRACYLPVSMMIIRINIASVFFLSR